MEEKTKPQDKYLTVKGLKLHYLEWGNKTQQTMLLLHGFQDCARGWDSFAKSISRDYHVIAMDHRGHGDSQWSPDAAYKLPDYIDDITGFVDQLGLQNVVLVGHSAGGRNAMVYIAAHPDKVERVVIVDIDPLSYNPETAKLFAWYKSESDEWDSLEAVVERLRLRAPRASDEILRHRAIHMTKELPGGRRIWKRDKTILLVYERAELWAYYRKINCPTLILRGEVSDTLTREVAQEMVQALPGAKLVEIKGAAHWCYDENPVDFEAAVREFLSK